MDGFAKPSAPPERLPSVEGNFNPLASTVDDVVGKGAVFGVSAAVIGGIAADFSPSFDNNYKPTSFNLSAGVAIGAGAEGHMATTNTTTLLKIASPVPGIVARTTTDILTKKLVSAAVHGAVNMHQNLDRSEKCFRNKYTCS